MFDILELLIEFLGINCQVVECYYPNVFESLFYLVFFPSILLIVFIYYLAGTILHGGGLPRGLKILISIAVYIFIILQKWYTIFVSLSKVWFIFVIIIGFLIYVGHILGRRTGGGTLRMPTGGGGFLESAKKLTIKAAKGDISAKEREIESYIKFVKNIADKISEVNPDTAQFGELEKEFNTRLMMLREKIEELENIYKLEFPIIGKKNIATSKTKKYWDIYNELLEIEAKVSRKK